MSPCIYNEFINYFIPVDTINNVSNLQSSFCWSWLDFLRVEVWQVTSSSSKTLWIFDKWLFKWVPLGFEKECEQSGNIQKSLRSSLFSFEMLSLIIMRNWLKYDQHLRDLLVYGMYWALMIVSVSESYTIGSINSFISVAWSIYKITWILKSALNVNLLKHLPCDFKRLGAEPVSRNEMIDTRVDLWVYCFFYVKQWVMRSLKRSQTFCNFFKF